jgi:hypothetical protein
VGIRSLQDVQRAKVRLWYPNLRWWHGRQVSRPLLAHRGLLRMQDAMRVLWQSGPWLRPVHFQALRCFEPSGEFRYSPEHLFLFGEFWEF